MWNWGSLVHVHLCQIFCTYCRKAFHDFTHFLYEFKSKCIYFEFDSVFKIFALKPVRLFLYDLFSIWLLACVFWLDADEALQVLAALVSFAILHVFVVFSAFKILNVIACWRGAPGSRVTRNILCSLGLLSTLPPRRYSHLHEGRGICTSGFRPSCCIPAFYSAV